MANDKASRHGSSGQDREEFVHPARGAQDPVAHGNDEARAPGKADSLSAGKGTSAPNFAFGYWNFQRYIPPLGEDASLAVPPVVTIFGAGIAGLSAAHELVERGLTVQVVEPGESPFTEYECMVGGLAANQFSRTPADIEVLYADLIDEINDNPDPAPGDPVKQLPMVLATIADKVRKYHPLQPGQPRFPLTQRIQFKKHWQFEQPGLDWRDQPWAHFEDWHGVTNRKKIYQVMNTIRDAYRAYYPVVRGVFASGDFETGAPESPVNPDHPHWKYYGREVLYVEIRGFTDTDGTAESNRYLATLWATAVKDALLDINANSGESEFIEQLDVHLKIVPVGDVAPVGDQSRADDRERSNRVEVRIVEQLLPGEHGFRFFPSFYRHLFDTMRRTPIFDRAGEESARTVFDQLERAPDASFALNDAGAPVGGKLRRFESFKELAETLAVFTDRIGFTERDLFRMQIRLFKYLASCKERRAREYEDMSFWEYIGGDDVDGYSEAAGRFIEKAPQALAAMRATETDTRTQGNILLQFLTKNPLEPFTDDLTLNGPTNEAWLDHWKSYLKAQGVRFFTGRLERLALEFETRQGAQVPRFVPEVSGPDGWTNPRAEDPRHTYLSTDHTAQNYFILTLSFDKASDIAWQAYLEAKNAGIEGQFTGPFGQMVEFDFFSGRRKRTDGANTPPVSYWNAETGQPRYRIPLRDINGVQYFWPNAYRIGNSHLYFTQSAWGLTSISQLAYWRRRNHPLGRFIGQYSVDVGDWYTHYPQRPRDAAEQDPGARTVWQSTRQEIAEVTWKQTKEGIDRAYAEVILPPRFYHLDTGTVFVRRWREDFGGNVTLRVNRAIRQLRYMLSVAVADGQGVMSPKKIEVAYPPVPGDPGASDDDVHGGAELTPTTIAKSLIGGIREGHGDRLAAFLDPPEDVVDDPQEIVLSPVEIGNRFVIAVRPNTRRAIFVQMWEDGSVPEPLFFFSPEPGAEPGNKDARIAALRKLRSVVEEAGYHSDIVGRFLVVEAGSDNRLVRLAVGNADGAIEIIDGNSINVTATSAGELVEGHQHLQVLHSIHGTYKNVTEAAFRGNARIGAVHATPGRRYDIRVRIGEQAPTSVTHVVPFQVPPAPAGADDDTDVEHRNKLVDVLFSEIQNDLPQIAVLKVEGPAFNSHRGETPSARRQAQIERHLLVSPVCTRSKIVVHVETHGRFGQPFFVFVRAGLKTRLVEATAATASAVVNDLVDALNALAMPISATALGPKHRNAFTIAQHDAAQPLSVAVLNDDGMIDIADGPRMELTVKDLYLGPLDHAVPLVNDTPFFINLPCQGRHQPGIHPHFHAGVPPGLHAEPHAHEEFEISYGHEVGSPLGRWFAAGGYMATHTRMMTMEAANESARHAVTALLHNLLRQSSDSNMKGAGVLFGDLPEFFDPERHEIRDFDYLKEVDKMLFDEDMPHFLDILRIPEYVDLALSQREEFDPLTDYLEDSLKTQSKISIQLAKQLLEPIMELIDPLLRSRSRRTGP